MKPCPARDRQARIVSCAGPVGMFNPVVGIWVPFLDVNRYVDRPRLHSLLGLGTPNDVVKGVGYLFAGLEPTSPILNLAEKVLAAEHLVHDTADQMDVLITDLDEDRPCLSQQLAGHDESIPQVREVGVDAQLPRVAEGPYLLRLAGEVLGLPVSHVPVSRAHLPV